MMASQWYLTMMDHADYATEAAIDALVDDLANAPDGELPHIHREGVRMRLQHFIKQARINLPDPEKGEAESIPLFQDITIDGVRMRRRLLDYSYAQTLASHAASGRRKAKADAISHVWDRLLGAHAKHQDVDLEEALALEGVEYSVEMPVEDDATGTDG